MAASVVSWRQHSTGGRVGARGPFLYDMLPSLAPRRGPGAEACGISPCDRDADPGYRGDVGAMRLRPPASAVSGRGSPVTWARWTLCYAGDGTGCGGATSRRGPGAGRPVASYFPYLFLSNVCQVLFFLFSSLNNRLVRR